MVCRSCPVGAIRLLFTFPPEKANKLAQPGPKMSTRGATVRPLLRVVRHTKKAEPLRGTPESLKESQHGHLFPSGGVPCCYGVGCPAGKTCI